MATRRKYGPPDIRGTTEETTLTEPFGEDGGGQYYQPEDEGLLEGPIAEGNIAGGQGPEQQGNLRPEDEQYYQDVEEFQGPEPLPPGFIGPGDAEKARRSKRFHDDAIKALAAGDEKLAASLTEELNVQLAISNVKIEAAGIDPAERAPNALYTDFATEMKRQAYIHLDKVARLNSMLKEMDWAGSEDFLRSGLDQYRERNESRYQIDTTGYDEMQLAVHRMQMEPLVMDPMVVADQQQKLAQINAQMKEIDPSWNIYSHPMTSKIANWIGREAGISTGFFKSDPSASGAPKGTVNEMMLTSLEAGEAFLNFPLELAYGGMELVGWTPPSNYIEGPDGKLYTNAGKVPGVTEIVIAAKAKLFGEDVARALGRAGAARAWETAQTNDFQKILRGSAATAGMLGGFGKVAGGFMGTGQAAGLMAMSKGLQYLPQMGERGTKIISMLGGTFGAAAGQGLAEGIAFGRHEGFWRAFEDGAKMAPVIMLIGAGGKWTEKAIRSKTGWRRRSMAMAGMVEGLGFEAMTDVMRVAAFEFVHDPNDDTLMRYAKAMLGFGLFKGIAKRSAVDIDFLPPGTVEGIKTARGVSRGAVAKRVSEVEEGLGAPRELTRKESDEAMRELGVEPPKAPPEKIDLEADLARARDIEFEGEMQREREMRREEGYPEAVEQRPIKGVQPSPEKQMEQARRGKLPEPERMEPGEKTPRELAREAEQGADPLEEPGFMQRPEAERRAIMEGGTAQERRQRSEAFEGPERRQVERRETEIDRLRQEGPTPENRKRLIELMQAQKGRLTEAAAVEVTRQIEVGVEAGERAIRERQVFRPTAEQIKEFATQRGQLQKIAKKMGVPYDMLKQLGDAMRVRGDPNRSAEERQAARQAIFELEKDLDISEISQDPVMSARLRQAQAEEALVEAETPGVGEPTEAKLERQQVDPEFGERYGPDSMRRGVNPYRQQEDPGEKLSKEEETMLSFIHQIMRGKQDKPGFRWMKRRFGAKKGSEVQIAMHAGHMGQKKASGLFKIFENLIQTQEGLDLVVNLHEWGHALQRQLHVGTGGGKFWQAVTAWRKALPPDAQAEIAKILENYPRWEKLTKKEQAAEAFAEWIVRDVLGDVSLEQMAPAFSREMLTFLAKHPRFINKGGQYYDLKKNLTIWTEMGSRRRMGRTLRRAGFEMEPYDKREFQEFSDQVIRAFFDDKIELKKSQERWLKRSDVDPKDLTILQDPSRMIDTLAMTAPKEAQSFLKNGPHDLAWRRIHGVKSFEEVIADVVGETKGEERNLRIIDFIDYIYGTRVLEKFAKAEANRKTFTMPIPKSDYVRGVADILAVHPELKGMATALKAWSDSLVDLVVEGGNLTMEDAARMKEEGTVYIPFIRILEGAASRFAPGRGAAEGGTGVKRMKEGSTFELKDPVESMEEVTTSMIVKARKNQVIGSLYQLSLHADVGGLVTIIPRANVPKEYRIDQIVRQIQEGVQKKLAAEEKAAKLDPIRLTELQETRRQVEETYGPFAEMFEGDPLSDTLITLFAQKDLPIGETDPIIAYTPRLTETQIEALPEGRAQKTARENNGKMIWLKVDKPAFEALMSVGAPMTRISEDYKTLDFILRTPAQFLRFFATDANPTFTVANLIRDISSAAVFSRDGKFEPLGGLRRVYVGAGLQLRYGTSPWFQKFLGKMKTDPDPTRRAIYEMFTASGASTASFHNEGARKALRGQSRGLGDQALKAIDAWTRFWTTPESWIRLGEYERIIRRNEDAVARGEKSGLEVGYEALEGAKEITVNFARAGNFARWYNQMTPYFAAGLAGQRKLIRAVMGMEGRSDEERASMQRAALANGFVSITLPVLAAWWMVHDEDWYKDLPQWRKSHFLNFKLGDSIVSLPLPFELGMIFGSIPMALMDHLTDSNPNELLPMFSRALFPYFTEMSSFVPQAIKPTAELATGRDFFRDRDITPFWTEQKRVPGEQMRGDTSRAVQGLWNYALPIGSNPIELEHWLGGHTGGFSTSIFRAIDEVFGLKEHPGMSAFTGIGPFINRFLRQTPHGASRTVDDMYREGKRIGQISAKKRTAQERRFYTRINRAKEAINKARRRFESGSMTKIEFDERQFELANRIMDSVRK